MTQEIVLVEVSSSGRLRFIYDDGLIPLLDEGDSSIVRASHVEPSPSGGWTADMSPVAGPLLGPYQTRCEALAAEHRWIETHLLGGTP